jgi:predicted nucleotidyltransferase
LSCVEAEQVILFGSYAYGTPREDSDYDFYIVLPDDFPLRPLDAMRTIRRNLGDTKLVPVDILTNYKHRYDVLSRLPTLARTIANKGVILYDRN